MRSRDWGVEVGCFDGLGPESGIHEQAGTGRKTD